MINTTTEFIDFANLICKLAGIDPIPVVFKDVTSYEASAFLPGANREQGYIAIGRALHNGNRYYKESVVIHEVCHFIYQAQQKERGFTFKLDHHGPEFKKIETRWLKEFGMVPRYSKAYCHALTDGNGKVLWSKYDIHR